MAERDFNDPAVKAIIEYSQKILGESNASSPFGLTLNHVGEVTIITNSYYADRADLLNDRRPMNPGRIDVILGAVSADGEPFVSLVPLRAALSAVADIALVKSQQRILEAINQKNRPKFGPDEDIDHVESMLDRPNWANENTRAKANQAPAPNLDEPITTVNELLRRISAYPALNSVMLEALTEEQWGDICDDKPVPLVPQKPS